MDLLIEKLDGSRYYLSQYKVLITDFEESAPSVTRNSKQLDQRNGNIDFGGWHTDKTIDITGYYRADDMDEEEALREKLYALLSDPDGYYITQLKTSPDTAVERPGETSGNYYDKLKDYPSHKRFLVYTEAPEMELVGNVNGTLLYKLTAEFKTLKLPYGETPAVDVAIDSPYKDVPVNKLHNTGNNWNPGISGTATTTDGIVTVTNSSKTAMLTSVDSSDSNWLISGAVVTVSVSVKGQGSIGFGYNNGSSWEDDSPAQEVNSSDYTRVYFTRTIKSVHLDAGTAIFSVNAFCPTSTLTLRHVKLEVGTSASPWSPNTADPEYNSWRYSLVGNVSVGTNLYADTKNFDNLASWYVSGNWTKTADTYNGLAVMQTTEPWAGLSQYVQVKKGDILTYSVYAKNISGTGTSTIFWQLDNQTEGSYSNAQTNQVNNEVTITVSWQRVSGTVVATSDGYLRPRLARSPDNTNTMQIAGIKVEKGSVATDWSPNPSDPEYNSWRYSLASNLSIPYSGSVPCNQLEQGFTVQLTAKDAASSLSFKIDDTELTYSGAVSVGDVFTFSGFSYTKNGLSIVSKTNKAYFVLQPDKPNRITCNVLGTVRIIGFQNLYA